MRVLFLLVKPETDAREGTFMRSVKMDLDEGTIYMERLLGGELKFSHGSFFNQPRRRTVEVKNARIINDRLHFTLDGKNYKSSTIETVETVDEIHYFLSQEISVTKVLVTTASGSVYSYYPTEFANKTVMNQPIKDHVDGAARMGGAFVKGLVTSPKSMAEDLGCLARWIKNQTKPIVDSFMEGYGK